MIVSELPTLETSGAMDSDDDSDGDEDGDVILDVRAARQKAKAVGAQKAPSVGGKSYRSISPKNRKKKDGRLREASWKVLELLISPQKQQQQQHKPDPPTRPKDATPRWPVGGPEEVHSAGAGLQDRMVQQQLKSSPYKEQLAALSASPLTLGTHSGHAQRTPVENALLVPLAASSSPARRLPDMIVDPLRSMLDAQPLSSLPPFRSVSSTSAVSSVASARAMDDEEEDSPLTFSANEEAIMDAILGL